MGRGGEGGGGRLVCVHELVCLAAKPNRNEVCFVFAVIPLPFLFAQRPLTSAPLFAPSALPNV